MKFFNKKKEYKQCKDTPSPEKKPEPEPQSHEFTIYNKGDIFFNQPSNNSQPTSPVQNVQQMQHVEIINNEDGIGNCLKNIFSCFKK